MKDINDITQKMRDILSSSSELQDHEVTIGGYANTNPSRKWIGIYKGESSSVPGQCGAFIWDTTFSIIVVVQAAYIGDGNKVDLILEDKVTKVKNSITGDLTLSGIVSILNGINVSYSHSKLENALFQEAMITFKYEVLGDE